MSETSRRVNEFFRTALRADVETIRSEILLSERQEKIFDLFYLRKNDINFVADTLCVSADTVNRELKAIRKKLVCVL